MKAGNVIFWIGLLLVEAPKRLFFNLVNYYYFYFYVYFIVIHAYSNMKLKNTAQI